MAREGLTIRNRRRRPWRRRVARGAAWSAVAVVVLYAAAPWWLPVGWLARRVQADLSEQLGASVTVGAVHAGWAEGVSVESIRVADPAFPAGEAMVEIPRLRMDFSPLRLLLRRTIGYVEAESPRIRLAVDEAGEWNLARLARPRGSLRCGRLSVRRAVVSVAGPDGLAPLRLEIADFECFFGGRRRPIERISLSAALVQASRRVPVGLTAEANATAAGRPGAMLTCNLRGLDLAELALIERLGLPLRRLEGVCDVRLRLPVVDGKIADGAAAVTADHLDIQPASGPRWPAMDAAGVTLTAQVDPAAAEAAVVIEELRAPGLRLDGAARLDGRLLSGSWRGGRSLELAGSVDGRVLSALLGGAEADLAVDGPVRVNLAYRREAGEAAAGVVVDAGAAEATAGPRVLKPAGETCLGRLRARWSEAAGRLNVDDVELRLGGTRLSGSAASVDLRRLQRAGEKGGVNAVAAALAAMTGSGRWETTDLDSLRRLAPAAADALAEARLEGGRLTGSWELTGEAGPRLRARIAAEAAGRLRVGRWLDKPDGVAMTFDADLRVDGDRGELGESTCVFACEGATTAVTFASTGEAPAPAHWLRGRYRVEQVERLLARVPLAAGLDGRVSGSASGLLALRLGGGAIAAEATCDAAPLAARIDSILDKRPGQPATARAHLHAAPADDRVTVGLTAAVDGAKASGSWDRRGREWRGLLDARIADMARLSVLVPAAERWGCRLAGAADLRAAVAGGDDGVVSVETELKADDLSVICAEGARRKDVGVPLRASAEAKVIAASPGAAASVDVSALRVRVGGSTLLGAGRVALSAEPLGAGSELTFRLNATVDEALTAAAPEVEAWLAEAGVVGGATGTARVWREGRAWRCEGRVDATALATGVGDPPAVVSKPAGSPAMARWSALWRDGGRRLRVTDWRGRLGSLEGMGDAEWRWPVGGPSAGRVKFRLWTDRAETIGRWLPAAAAWEPRGDVEVLGELRRGADGLDLDRAVVRMKDFGTSFRGRRVTADGTIRLNRVRLAGPAGRPAPISIERATTDDLRLRSPAGAIRVAADLRGLPRAVAGRVVVLGDRIDADVLQQWLAPTPERPPLSPGRREALTALCRGWIDRARPYAVAADLTVEADVGRIKNVLDERVGRTYDARDVSLRAGVKGGRVELQYVAGVNGGTLIDRFETDLTSPTPRLRYVNTVRDMMAADNLQPQVAAFFPGNEVRGAMWREMDVRTPLADFAATLLDPRLRPRYDGWGKTTLIEGVTRGRAAPRLVTRVFPGLNLVDYAYERMVAFTEYRPDGSAHNDMIFTGKTYNLFVEGDTDPDNVAAYDVGVILARTSGDAEWHHRYKQGRILLLQHTLKIVDGAKADEIVAFPWPNETMFLFFVKNNYFYRLWLERKNARRDGR